MRAYNVFIGTLAVVFTVITTALAALGVDSLDIYFTVYVVALVLQSSLFLFFNRQARRALSLVSLVAIAGFMVMVSIKAVEMMSTYK